GDIAPGLQPVAGHVEIPPEIGLPLVAAPRIGAIGDQVDRATALRRQNEARRGDAVLLADAAIRGERRVAVEEEERITRIVAIALHAGVEAAAVLRDTRRMGEDEVELA